MKCNGGCRCGEGAQGIVRRMTAFGPKRTFAICGIILSNEGITMFRTFSILMLFCVIACSTTPNNTTEFKLLPPDDEVYRNSLEQLRHRLGLYRTNEESSVEQVLMVLHESFGSTIGISLIRDIEISELPETEKSFEDYSLNVSIWNHSQDEYAKKGEVGKFTSVIERYHVEISNDDVQRVANSLEQAAFYSENFSDKPDVLWTDGTIYFVEARIDGKYNLIARHSCDKRFNEKLIAAGELFELARLKIPMVEAQLRQSEAEILTSPACE